MSEWISVKDRSPDKTGYIMVVKGDYLPFIGLYYADTGRLVAYDESYSLRFLTHWMPLPEPPKIKKSCPECGGNGELLDRSWLGPSDDGLYTCPTCQGTGEIDDDNRSD
jgi:hypothetical protein